MSTISVSNIATANGTTALTLTTGNTSAGSIVVNSTEGAVISSNSSVNAIIISSGSTSNVLVSNSSGAYISNGNFVANSSGTFDTSGNLRDLPVLSKAAVYQLASTDTGDLISTTANVTVNGAVLSTNQNFTIFNNSASSITITQGTGVTMYLAGTSSTGNRTLSQRGLATVICVGSNTFVVSGSGLS